MIDFPGCTNLRDVGGLATVDGSRVARGRLFRGACPPVDADLVGALGILRVIDLRAASEFGTEFRGAMPSWTRFHIPILEDLSKWPDPVERSPRSIGARYLDMLEEGQPALLRILRLWADRINSRR
ncbi:MAG: hypothetical protein GEU90_08440 [Gemmatimonas sp.]|nr:hypothetical protein [Gemmatimonas sp.]